MKPGYQGEPHSYSFQALHEIFPDSEAIGYGSFAATFEAFDRHEVDQLVVPVENSTTGSILPVLDRLSGEGRKRAFSITAEHLVEVRHTLFGLPGATLGELREIRSHPEALAQAERTLLELDVAPRPVHDTAGALRQVREDGDASIGALASPSAGAAHGLEALRSNVLDREHNTTRFVVLTPGAPVPGHDANKATLVLKTAHTPGALALALTELGRRGANLTRIESRPAGDRWAYRFFVDLTHTPGPEGLARVVEPAPSTCIDLRVLGSYVAATL